MLAAGAALGAFAIAPSGASAISQGCTQTNSPPAGEPTEWTCYTNSVSVSGYEVKQNNMGNIPKPPVDGHITKMEVDIVDSTAAQIPIDRLMLHHIVFLNGGRGDAACGGPERFFAAGEERAKMSLPAGYGYPLNPAAPWFLTYMYMNHRQITDSAFIEYKLTVAPASAGLQSVRSYWLDAGDCTGDPIYNVPGIEQPPELSCDTKVKKKLKGKKRKKAKKRANACRQAIATQEAAKPKDATHEELDEVVVGQSGRFVAGAGHVHGGAKELSVTKPACGDLEIAESTPTWGNPDHPFYNVKPILHEPGPIGMSAFKTPTGIPVQAGQTIRLRSLYDNLQPHTRVMGIMVLYLAPDPAAGANPCGGAPADIEYGPGTNLPGRTYPIPFKVPLTGLDAARNAIEIQGPPGDFKTLASGSTVAVGDRFFSEGNINLLTGSTLNYSFGGNEEHNVTLANGPMGIGSVNQRTRHLQPDLQPPGHLPALLRAAPRPDDRAGRRQGQLRRAGEEEEEEEEGQRKKGSKRGK